MSQNPSPKTKFAKMKMATTASGKTREGKIFARRTIMLMDRKGTGGTRESTRKMLKRRIRRMS